MKNIRSNAPQILTENWKHDGSQRFLADYVIDCCENDPAFLRWLFDDDNINDFGKGMTPEQKEEYNSFFTITLTNVRGLPVKPVPLDLKDIKR